MTFEHGLLFIIVGSIGAFFMAFNNGANDVANAFASAVGSKALKMKLAVAIASVVTFSGALLLGGHVATKLVTGLVPPDKFSDPHSYILAMVAVLFASGIFVLISTLTALPVSSSQAIVGSLTGIAIVLCGWHAAPWSAMLVIVIGWIVSPLLAGILSVIMCTFIEKKLIGHTAGIIERMNRWLPILVSLMLCAGIYALFTLTELKQSIGIDAHKCFVEKLTKNERMDRELDKIDQLKALADEISKMADEINLNLEKVDFDDDESLGLLIQKFYQTTGRANDAMQQLQVLATGRLPAIFYLNRWHVAAISLIMFLPLYMLFKRLVKGWLKHAEDSIDGAQNAFKNLQIGTSCYVAFAIGSNDVANSISPVLAIYLVVTSGGIPELFSTQMPIWILILGGAGMAAGISILGKRVMKTLGERLTTINNSRGFCVDFSVATSVVGASAVGIPVSTTHAATGAIVGSGLAQGWGNVQLRMLGKIAVGWLVTIPISAVITVIIFKMLTLVW